MRVTLKVTEVLARLQEKLKVGTSTKRERLVALLGRLGSDQDGEVLVAARMATKLVNEMGLTWDYVLRQEGDSGVTISSNTAEVEGLQLRLKLAQEMLASSQHDRRLLEQEISEMRRRAYDAESQVQFLRDIWSSQMKESGREKTNETATERVMKKGSEQYYANKFYSTFNDGYYSPEENNEFMEVKSRWTKDSRLEQSERSKRKFVYSFADKEVTDMLWTADAPQAAEYCLKSRAKWTYEETLFLQGRVSGLVISGEELARLRVMFAKARAANNATKSGATA